MRTCLAAICLLFAAFCSAQPGQTGLVFTRYHLGGVLSGPVIVADFNGDGRLDILGGNESDSVSVILGNGDGTFQAPLQSPVDALLGNQAVADFNGDGILDCVVSYSSVIVLLGNGDGTFQPGKTSPLTFGASGIAAADFNGDHKLDLVVGGTGQIAILLGNGDGTFQPELDFATGSANDYSFGIADFNGDGTLDIVTTGEFNAITVLLGNGDGTFRPAVDYSTSGVPNAVLTADFNHDGIADIAVQNANPSASNISVLLGNGDGTFGAPVNYQAPQRASSFASGDFNRDGIIDLVTAGLSEDVVMVRLGNGDGTFGSPSFAEVNPSASSVATGDLDGDGLGDIVTSSNRTGIASVLLHVDATLSQTLVNFGNVPIGRRKISHITITNTGASALTVSDTQLLGEYSQNFIYTTACVGITLNPGGTCTFDVGLAPISKIQLKAVLSISYAGVNGTQSVTLAGNPQ